ncbi:hypothetical protein H2200_013472 [Cladophialophora chaetospira]|uniref:Uncharacterized protein n=1 Tax=Cladophialophora chaetospira TaxID=386627 RepID=A0AA38WQ21_9EURO|nr:hypothetical protein H2200_013472 [Cladophialophora chaetospira]
MLGNVSSLISQNPSFSAVAIIVEASALPTPVPLPEGVTYSRFISHILVDESSEGKGRRPTHPIAVPASFRASNNSPSGGEYFPGIPAISASKFWKARSKPNEAAYE